MNLKKGILVYKKQFEKIKKDKEKILLERNSVKLSFNNIKKTNLPKITNFKKQIDGLEKDLKAGRKIQERLDNLDLKYGKLGFDQGGIIIATNNHITHQEVCFEIKKIIKKYDLYPLEF